MLFIVVCFWGDVRIVGELIKVGVDFNLKNIDKILLISVC